MSDKSDRRAWLAEAGVEDALAAAVAKVLQERPTNPLLAIGQFLKNQAAGGGICDAHHHFYATGANAFSSFLKSQAGDITTTPEAYASEADQVPVVTSVHVEAVTDDGAGADEATWVNSLIAAGRNRTVKAIVAGVDLGSGGVERVDQQLSVLSGIPRVVGIRWILDWDGGPFDGGNNATHIGTKRNPVDYLRDTDGPAPSPAARFAEGYALLGRYSLSFDLQCAPAQLPAAAALVKRHPEIPVVIDHLGKLKGLKGDGGSADAAELARWRCNMAKMAAAGKHVHLKLSMLGFAVPGWAGDPKKEALVRSLVRDMIRLFTPKRCMFASNWHGNGATSNSDGADDVEISMKDLYAKFRSWVSDFSPEDQARLFEGTAKAFYKISAPPIQ